MLKLSDKDIVLRALEPDDLDFLFRTENDVSLWEVSNTQVPFSKFILKQYLANAHQDIFEAKQLRLVIDIKGVAIGMIDLFDFDPQHHRAGVGIVILKEFQHKGFASTALKLCIDYAFNILDLHAVYANITTDNMPSIRLFTNHNFVLVGVKKDWIYYNKTYKDEALYQLINN